MVKNYFAAPGLARTFTEEMRLGNPNYLVALQSLDPGCYTPQNANVLWWGTVLWRQKPVIL